MLTNAINKIWCRYKILRMGMRLLVFLILSIFCVKAFEAYVQTEKINYLILLVAELFTVVLVIFSRDTKMVNLSPLAIASTLGGTFYYYLFDFFQYPTLSLINSDFGVYIQIIGIILQLLSKASLGFSFGLAPANRGIKIKGAYRFVRHPIYASYLIAHIGFILSFFSLFNFLVLCLNWACQIIRIFEEEKILMKDEVYVNYVKQVRWRLIPGIF